MTQLTQLQLAALAVAVSATPAWSALPNDSTAALQIATELNLPSADFFVYRTTVLVDDIFDQIVWANFTSNGAPDGTAAWTNRALACQGKQFNIQTMLTGRITLNTSKPRIRAGLQDALTEIPSGNNGNLRQGGWADVATILYRLATRGERIFATGTGTTVAPAMLTFEGQLGFADVQAARSL